MLRLYGEMPPEMGLRFDLTFKATADRRECKTRSMVDGELYPAEQERTLEAYYPDDPTYQTNVPLRWPEKSACDYAISKVAMSFPHRSLEKTRGSLYVMFRPDPEFKNLSSSVPLKETVNYYCDVNSRDRYMPVSCGNEVSLRTDANFIRYYVTSLAGKDTTRLNFNLTVRKDA